MTTLPPVPEPGAPLGVVAAARPRCTVRCFASCARLALTAGHEGSGLALPLPGAEARCGFHQDLVAAPRRRPGLRLIGTLLRVVRSGRAWVQARPLPAPPVVYSLRVARAAPAAPVAAAPAVEAARATTDDPACTLRCLARCARAGLTAGLEGSGLGLSGEGRCRVHRALLEEEHGSLRRAIARTLLMVRMPRAWARRMSAWGRAARTGAGAARVDFVRRVRDIDARLHRDTAGGVAAAAHRHQRLIVALARGAMSAMVVRVRRVSARARPRAWWPAVRARARVRGEALTRRAIDHVTELLIRAVPRPKPPVRSVAHVSLISHKQYMLSRLARNHGLKGTFLAINTYPGAHLKIGFDYEVPMNMAPFRRHLRASWYLWRVLAWHDVIHYHFNGFLFDDGYDLRVLQRMGKVIVVHYRGCDVRCRSINMAKNPGLNVCQECSYPPGSCDTDYQRGKIAISRAHSDVRFVTTPDLLDFAEDAEHLPFIAPYGIDFSAIEPAPRTPGVFRVVTSSNHPALDGVRFVRDAVDRLASEGVAIELVEVYRQSFFEALALYKSADLYCGKLRMGYYNNANIESLMLGVPNMSYIRDEYLHKVPDSPIIVARPENVYERLKEWVGRPEELRRLGALGPAFVRRHHQADELMAHMIARYNQALQRKAAAGYEAAVESSLLH